MRDNQDTGDRHGDINQGHCRQQLSAMLDGELSPDESRFLLRRLQHDRALAGCWERWQVCGDAMRGSVQTVLPSDFAQRVADAVKADSTVPLVATASAASGTGRSAAPRLWRWGAGAALAASVAAATFLVGRPVEPGADADVAAGQLATSEAAHPVSGSSAGPATPGSAVIVPARAVVAGPGDAQPAPARMAGTNDGNAGSAAGARAVTPVQPVQDEPPPAARLLAGGDTRPDNAGSDRSQPSGQPPSDHSRPWPRSVLPDAGRGQFQVGYGALRAAHAGVSANGRPVDGVFVQELLPPQWPASFPMVPAPAEQPRPDTAP